ncbi:unnamed protein product [Acanthoscelides obtectus]|uniref:Uncharacterized protein n=1 Tax=Acanthoscelides obtectus TaxID=200917 RepID=A0A9P0PNV2_ACAOB|nr:unnamed protein product [Acanthoscelides obtectus]CAK1638412.1 hypothetical protein AOBTE_LOCUS10590 [Acanthoscelides obtectus]
MLSYKVYPFTLEIEKCELALIVKRKQFFSDVQAVSKVRKNYKLTLKKAAVDPPLYAPYLIFVCLARSSALSIGESIRSTVRKAARLAVYDEIMMSVKNHHIPATILVDTALEIHIV